MRRIIAVLLTVMMVLLPSFLGAEDDFTERQPYHSDWWHPPVEGVTGEYSFSGTGDAVLLPYLLGLHGIYGIVISAVADSDAVALSDDLYLTAVASFDTVRLTVTTNFGTHVFLLHNPGEAPAIPAGTEVTGDSGSFTASGEVPAGTGLFVGAFEPSEQQRAAVPAGSDTSVVWLEIGLRSPEGAEVHTGAEVSVNTRIELPAAPALNGLSGRTVVRDARLYHVVSGAEVEELPVEVETADGCITALRFSTESFSGFALSYTVDFTYEGRAWSFPGQGSYLLVDALANLGIEGNIDDAALTITMGEDHAGALYLTQADGEYYINSDIAFTDTYELRVRSGEKIYIITVTDTQTSTDLSDFLKNVVITGATQDSDGKYHVESGEEYSIILTFAEGSDYQFNNTGTLTYQMPEGIVVLSRQENDGNINIVYKGRTYQIPFHYVLETDGSLSIDFDTTDPDFPRLEESTNVSFRFTYNGEFDQSKTKIRFNDVIERDIIFDGPEPGQAYAEKKGEFDETTGKINYTITVTAVGDVTDVHVKDLMSGNALIFNNDVHVSGNSSNYTDNHAENGFDYTFASMSDGEVITITYSCGLNFSLDTDKDGKLSVDQTKNTVTVEPDSGDPHTAEYSREIVFQTTTKSDGVMGETVDGDRIIEWTIEYNNLALISAAGDTITDRISSLSAPYMKYYGSGINVDVYDQSGNKVDTREVSYTDLTAYSADSWTYTIPDEDTTPYKYVITYKTRVDMAQIEQGGVPVTLYNSANYDGGQIVATPSNVADITKRVADQTEEYVEWESVITVPENGLSQAEVIDVFPAIWMPLITGNQQDNYNIYEEYIEGSLDIQGRLEGEEYTLEVTDTNLIITFYKDSAKSQPGLQAHAGGHQITIKLKTEVNPTWLEKNYNSPGDNNSREHVNRISINSREATATALFSKPSLVKKGPDRIHTWTDWTQGQKKYKYLRYEIWLKGVKNEPVTVTDRFDTSVLKLVDQYVASSDHANLYEHMILTGGDYTDQADDKATPVSYTDTADGFSITIDQLPKNNDGQFYQNYKIVYYLQLKDGVDLEQLAIANGGEYDLTNTALWNDYESSFTYKTKYDFLNKELLNEGQLGGTSRKAQYRITFNSAKATLNQGEPMVMTDVLSPNLSVDYSSIRIDTDPAGQAVPYSLSGGKDESGKPDGTTVATYTVPDSTRVVITYDADVRGNNNQTIVNKVSVNGEDETITTTKSYGADSEGEGAIASFKIVKVDGYDANKKLKGVRFRIFAENPNIDFGNGVKELVLETDENGEIILDGEKYQIMFGETYHVQEVEALEDYGNVSFDYLVTLTTDMAQVDYGDYIYYYNDSMQIKNWPLEGLVVEKHVESTDDEHKDQYYRFRVSILKDDGSVNTEYNEKNGDDQFVNGSVEFELKDKEQKMFWGFHKGTKYLVEEIDSKGLAVSVTYKVYDEDGNVTETITDQSASHTGTLMQPNEIIIFKNSTEIPAAIDIPVIKILKGRDMAEGEFAFVLQPIDKNGNRDDTAKQIAYNPAGLANQEVTFHFTLNYSAEDIANAPYKDNDGNSVYFYVVYEEWGNDTNILYSDQQYIVKVTLSQDTDGHLVAMPQYFLYDGEGPLPSEATGQDTVQMLG